MLTDEYAELVADIRANGLQVPVTLLDGKILDGRHRARACNDLGITPQTMIFAGTEAEAKTYVLSLNVQRRHLTLAQKRELILVELKLDPTQSDRAIAKKAKVSHNTVAKARSTAEDTGQIDQCAEHIGVDGVKRSAKKAPKKADEAKKPIPKRDASKPKDLDAQRILQELAAIVPSELTDSPSFAGELYGHVKRFAITATISHKGKR